MVPSGTLPNFQMREDRSPCSKDSKKESLSFFSGSENLFSTTNTSFSFTLSFSFSFSFSLGGVNPGFLGGFWGGSFSSIGGFFGLPHFMPCSAPSIPYSAPFAPFLEPISNLLLFASICGFTSENNASTIGISGVSSPSIPYRTSRS